MKAQTPFCLLFLLPGLFLVAFDAVAATTYPPLADGDIVFWSKGGEVIYYDPPGYDGSLISNLKQQAQPHLQNCNVTYPDKYCRIESELDAPIFRSEDSWGNKQYRQRGRVRVVARGEPCANLTHEGGGGDVAECGMCADGYISATGAYDPESGSGTPAPAQCMRNREPNECQYLDKYEVLTELGAFCVDQCSGGSLDNKCLLDLEPDPDQPECGPDHPEFKGVIGYGNEAALVCGSGNNQCPAGSSYGFHQQSDGSYKASCFPSESNPPQCPGGSAVIMGKNGISFQCGEIRNPDATPEDLNDAMSGDSDGDGQGDITGITNQLGKIQELLNKGNNNTNNINETLKGIGKQIKDGTKSITDAIGNIPGGGGGGNGNGSGDGDGDGEDPAINWSGNAIDTELTDPADDYDQVMSDYQTKINEIKDEVRALFSTNLSGGGTIEDNIKTIKGVEVNFSLNRFLDGLNIIGAIVLFVAAFISAGILFTSRG